MDAWQRTLDWADDDTAKEIVKLQMQDVKAFVDDTDGTAGAEQSDAQIARHTFMQELRNYCVLRGFEIDETSLDHESRAEIREALPDLASHTEIDEALPAQEGHTEIEAGLPEQESSKEIDEDPPEQETHTEIDEGLPEQQGHTSPPVLPDTETEPATFDPIHDAPSPVVLGKRKRTDEHVQNPAPQDRVKLFECVSCSAEKPAHDVLSMPCNEHTYCDRCIKKLFRLALKDDSLYPPRCCNIPIPLEDARLSLGPDLAEEFARRQQELDDKNKLYCHVPTCSTYIGTHDREEEKGSCSQCQAQTCVKCKLAAHDGECTEDEDLKSVMILAKDAGWQQCRPCGRVLEHTFGCWHMTCPCKAEFCYICAEVWKTCKCTLWTEERLFERAGAVVQRETIPRPMPAPRVAGGLRGRSIRVPRVFGTIRRQVTNTGNYVEDPVRVAAMVEHLRIHGDCHSHDTTYIPGRAQCDDCRDVLPNYLHRCSTCHSEVCNWCLLFRGNYKNRMGRRART